MYIYIYIYKQHRIGIPNDEFPVRGSTGNNVCHQFLKKGALEGKLLLWFNGPFLGSCYDFYLITFIQRPSLGACCSGVNTNN